VKICVLQPDYSTSKVDYANYDPPRDLSALLPGHVVHHVALNKLSTYRQLKELSREGYDIFVNLCEGYLEWDVPSIDVIHAMDALELPYTGPTATLYDPPKVLMKYVAHTMDVRTPLHTVVTARDDAAARARKARLRYPLFVKPSKAGDSLGVDEHSLVNDEAELEAKVRATIDEYPELLIEEYVDGREFTVLVVGDPTGGDRCTALAPIEYVFPEGHRFKSYALKTSELHPDANVRVRDEAIWARLKDHAERIFRGFNASGYARMDFRMDAAGELYFLEVNFTCSVFYAEGYEGSADHILRVDGLGQAGFLRRIIEEGLARHRRTRKKYVMRGNTIAGYGIVARGAIAAGEVVFKGEERSQRIVTKRHVEEHWSEAARTLFRHYAFPLSDEVYVLWDDEASQWAPQNHSCAPNTAFAGLDVVALRDIAEGEELTLDYAEVLDEGSEPFVCACGTSQCRGVVRGMMGNSVTARLKNAGIAADT
jgi:hypothetical protein